MSRIQNNMMAMNTHRQYTINNAGAASSAEKLSSGYRINRAGDDAAGLAISEKMRAQVRGLNMASKNSQDAISLVQTAEGALQEVHTMLQRMNELADQAATGTNETFDRSAINNEFEQLKSEIDDISNQTSFNNMKLLDGSLSNIGTVEMGTTANAAGDGTLNTATISFKDLGTGKMDPSLLHGKKISIGEDVYILNAGMERPLDTAGATEISLEATDLASAADLATKIMGEMNQDKYTITDNADGTLTVTEVEDGGIVADKLTPNIIGVGGIKIQVGANQMEELNFGIKDLSAKGLGVDTLSIATQESASAALGKGDDGTNKASGLKSAINQVSDQRAMMGAIQNRLQHKINNLEVSAENLQAAESRIRDVDMAKEMTNFTKQNILSQASTAMLAQANAAPQNVLQLLG